MLDAENRRLTDNLASKVSRLKSVSDRVFGVIDLNVIVNPLEQHQHKLTCFMWQLAFEIDREADDQNDYLDNMVRKNRFMSYCQ